MRRILITGGAGFIGANFVHYWRRTYPADHVVVLDSLTYAGNLANLQEAQGQPNFRFIRGDIRDYELVRNLLIEERLDTIVHFAAESHVDRSILGPDAFVETNIVGTHTLLKAAKSAWLDRGPAGAPSPHRFHQVSTDEVFGSLSPVAPPFTEETPYAPNSPYAASKAAADHLVRAYHQTYGLEVTISNCSNNYGPYQFPEKLIPLVLVNILEGRPLPIYGDGRNIRDWLYVEDHCRGIDCILQQGRVGECYAIGGDNEKSNIEIVELVCRLVDEKMASSATLRPRFPRAPAASGRSAKELITYVKDRPGHDRRYAIDGRKIKQALGFTAAESFATGIVKTIDWYLANEIWWRQVMDGSYRQWIDSQYGPRAESAVVSPRG
ncbi:MAG: dTDP-glucose 4,6-dehydratase [Desulfobacteraceae bacterium]|nr:MAG: dTDP-glucose 4,6-dehydratase [Desulfobacteraceae bacterium]